ncbi:hypothetical protein HYQ46_012040 [Verticillium longisporum]|nr:hypothetical protein HYQ46_012040 [Verticillium longisporum]
MHDAFPDSADQSSSVRWPCGATKQGVGQGLRVTRTPIYKDCGGPSKLRRALQPAEGQNSDVFRPPTYILLPADYVEDLFTLLQIKH